MRLECRRAAAAEEHRSYAGRDEAGVPRYVRRIFSPEEKRVLREQFGYAVDVTVDDGDIRHVATREHWVAFPRWIETSQRGVFRIIGTPDQSWDWPHIEYVGRLPGFGLLEELLSAARWCDSSGTPDCTTAWRERAGD